MLTDEFINKIAEEKCPKCNQIGLIARSVGFNHLDVNGVSHWNIILICYSLYPPCVWKSKMFDSNKINRLDLTKPDLLKQLNLI